MFYTMICPQYPRSTFLPTFAKATVATESGEVPIYFQAEFLNIHICITNPVKTQTEV